MRLHLSENQLQTQIRYFAYYEIASGILTTGFVVFLLAQTTSLLGLALLLYVGFLALTGFTIYCGYLTLKHPYRGLQLSRISLMTQFLGFAAGGYSFRYFAGPFLAISADLTNDLILRAEFAFGEFNFKINGSSDTLLLSINAVAMLLFWRTTFWLNEWHIRYIKTRVLLAE
ncbi:hypothetical protein GKZ68_07750 [Hymenobacter sp. BRD128]|uniref:hypothetical protein n=1 Tax=Hymenobacter sp. BRD128 TaxID=2675878 RepID=UPI00156550AA|nr:hypothetical protein [Hymenobacter sp. BRD128]QKG56533.1 hypothetical protein GKZ68_07750 [Hymenobacter sp. BRD128]